jgi:hypothetical protein
MARNLPSASSDSIESFERLLEERCRVYRAEFDQRYLYPSIFLTAISWRT